MIAICLGEIIHFTSWNTHLPHANVSGFWLVNPMRFRIYTKCWWLNIPSCIPEIIHLNFWWLPFDMISIPYIYIHIYLSIYPIYVYIYIYIHMYPFYPIYFNDLPGQGGHRTLGFAGDRRPHGQCLVRPGALHCATATGWLGRHPGLVGHLVKWPGGSEASFSHGYEHFETYFFEGDRIEIPLSQWGDMMGIFC